MGGLGIEKSSRKQLWPVSEPRVWDVGQKNGEVWADYRGPKCWKKEESKSLPLEQGIQHL